MLENLSLTDDETHRAVISHNRCEELVMAVWPSCDNNGCGTPEVRENCYRRAEGCYPKRADYHHPKDHLPIAVRLFPRNQISHGQTALLMK